MHLGSPCLLVVLVVVHRGDGVEDLFIVVVHAQRVTALGKDDQKPCASKTGDGGWLVEIRAWF